MPTRRRSSTAYTPVHIRTTQLLNLVHLGQMSDDATVTAAAESLRSLIAFKLKDAHIWVDSDMMEHYVVLYDTFTNSKKEV